MTADLPNSANCNNAANGLVQPPTHVEPDDPLRLCDASPRIRVVTKFQMFTPDESLDLRYDLLNSG